MWYTPCLKLLLIKTGLGCNLSPLLHTDLLTVLGYLWTVLDFDFELPTQVLNLVKDRRRTTPLQNLDFFPLRGPGFPSQVFKNVVLLEDETTTHLKILDEEAVGFPS